MEGAALLKKIVAAFPYKIHKVLTDDDMACAGLPKIAEGPAAAYSVRIFDRVCAEHGIEHRLTKPYHPWANGQAERMYRTVKDATVQLSRYSDLESCQPHVLAFLTAYNFAKHLRNLDQRLLRVQRLVRTSSSRH